MPHTDPEVACRQITEHLKDIPTWPQLPKRSFLENMCVQYSEGFPGLVVRDDSIYVDRRQDTTGALAEFYTAYLENDVDKYPISPNYAAGLDTFLRLGNLTSWAVKGHVTGPVTWGLTVTDEEKRGILYDEVFGDVVAKLVRLKAAWQEKQLRQISKHTIMFFDEPYMSAYGATGVILSRERIIELLEEAFGGVEGLTGVHCCGNTDWSILLDTSVDILSFDTYNYPDSLSLYPQQIQKFLGRGGTIAWGIVPTDEEAAAGETVANLQDRLEAALGSITKKGIPFRDLITQGLLTPSCGLGTLRDEAAVTQIMGLLRDLSARVRQRYA
jgi:hypothetical protein